MMSGGGPEVPGVGFQAWASGRGWGSAELAAASEAWGEVERRAMRWARVFGREGAPAGRLGDLLADAVWIMAEAVDALAARGLEGGRAWGDLDDVERDVARARALEGLGSVDAGRYWALVSEYGPRIGTAVQAGRSETGEGEGKGERVVVFSPALARGLRRSGVRCPRCERRAVPGVERCRRCGAELAG